MIIDYVNSGGLDLSKEALWASVVQRTAKLQASKVGDLEKSCYLAKVEPKEGSPGLSPEWWDHRKVWLITTLQPFNLQRLTVTLIKNLLSDQEPSSTFRIGFALSKKPNFNSFYLLGVWYSFSETVDSILKYIISSQH